MWMWNLFSETMHGPGFLVVQGDGWQDRVAVRKIEWKDGSRVRKWCLNYTWITARWQYCLLWPKFGRNKQNKSFYLNFKIRLLKDRVRMKGKYRTTLVKSGEVGFWISNVNIVPSLMWKSAKMFSSGRRRYLEILIKILLMEGLGLITCFLSVW